MSVDFETIEHLDFEISEDSSIKCDGMVIAARTFEEVIEDVHCDNPAVMMAFRACCGHVDLLCLSCYNIHLQTIFGSIRRGTIRPCKFCDKPRPIPPYSSTLST